MKLCSYIYKIGTSTRISLLIMTLLLAFLPQGMTAQLAGKYTNNKPLVIVCGMTFAPYQFSDKNGEPVGINIDILDEILTQMHIPHQFISKEWNEAETMFKTKQADLILDPTLHYCRSPYYGSRNSLTYYRMKLVRRAGEDPVRALEELEGKTVLVTNYDSLTHNALLAIDSLIIIKYVSPEDAINSIASREENYMVWSEEALKWRLKEMNLEEYFVLSDIEMPVREIRYAGHDATLIEQIDDQYARMLQNGTFSKIHDKWFHPDRQHNDTTPVAIYITVFILLIAIALFLTNRLITKRITAATSTATDIGNIMRQALSMGNYSIVFYDIKTDRINNRHGHLLPDEGITMQEYIAHIHPDEQETIRTEIEKLKNGRNGICETHIRWNAGTPEQPQWRFMNGHSIAELNDDGHTCHIVNAMKDVTEEVEQERINSELATKYIKMFDSTLVAMSFYDRNGMLIDLNQNMRKLCEFELLGEKFFKETCLFDVAGFKNDFDHKSKEHFHVCQHMYYPEIGINKYIECRIMPTYDNNELQYYIITSRDVTAERNIYKELNRQDAELHKINNIATNYEQQLHYLLENSNMWVWRSDVKQQRIFFSRSLQKDDFSYSFKDYLALIDESCLEQALHAFGDMAGKDIIINTVILLKSTPNKNEPQWFAISGVPVHDKDGHLTGHLGVVRDVSNLMEAQEKLKKETARAEDSGRLKSAFLANMTHEIRTPLNAIVGFSDLLQVIDSPEERREFIRIIRNNCDMLIRLINDIIETSSINQEPLRIESTEIDFARAFNDICQTLAQRVQEPGVEFMVDNPYQSFITRLDKGRMQQIITNFTTNAVKYTHEGHIKVGYEYLSFEELKSKVQDSRIMSQTMPFSGIYMYCEDTGSGIPKEKQGSVFERFVKLNDYVQGTGLGLAICKSIVERCAGRIGVMSEGEGHGSTFWVWIPCIQLKP